MCVCVRNFARLCDHSIYTTPIYTKYIYIYIEMPIERVCTCFGWWRNVYIYKHILRLWRSLKMGNSNWFIRAQWRRFRIHVKSTQKERRAQERQTHQFTRVYKEEGRGQLELLYTICGWGGRGRGDAVRYENRISRERKIRTEKKPVRVRAKQHERGEWESESGRWRECWWCARILTHSFAHHRKMWAPFDIIDRVHPFHSHHHR